VFVFKVKNEEVITNLSTFLLFFLLHRQLDIFCIYVLRFCFVQYMFVCS